MNARESPAEAFARYMREPDPVPAGGAAGRFETAREMFEEIAAELFGVDAYLIEVVPADPEPGDPVQFTRAKIRGPREMVARIYEELFRRGEQPKGGGK